MKAKAENGLARPLAEICFAAPRAPQRVGVLRLVSAEVFPGLAQRSDGLVLARCAGP
jgi:hypothetical protein